jgi:hypothetical protein
MYVNQMAIKFIDERAVKHINIFHSKALKNIPKWVFFGMQKYHPATQLLGPDISCMYLSIYLYVFYVYSEPESNKSPGSLTLECILTY